MHSNSIGCPNIFPPFAPVLYWLSHLTCIWVWKLKTSEKCWFSQSWKYPDTSNTFSLFLDEFLEIGLRPIYCSLTCAQAGLGPVVLASSFLLLFLLASKTFAQHESYVPSMCLCWPSGSVRSTLFLLQSQCIIDSCIFRCVLAFLVATILGWLWCTERHYSHHCDALNDNVSILRHIPLGGFEPVWL